MCNDENFTFGVNNRKFQSLVWRLVRRSKIAVIAYSNVVNEVDGRLEVRLPMEAYKEQLKIQA